MSTSHPFRHLRIAVSAALVAATIVTPTLGSGSAHALGNGLALTPPMGLNSWNYFGCNIDQWKIMGMADAMVKTGLRDAGYIYLNMDDCWQAAKRNPDGSLAWDKKRFPDGIKALGDYIHARGLKFGIYGNPGRKSCAEIYKGYQGAMGSYGHEYHDARTYASWGVDYLKYDWCRAETVTTGEKAFTLMRDALRATGRPIVYSIHYEPELPVQDWYPKVANLWRTTPDIFDSWMSVAGITMMNIPQGKYAKPGAWNDPDMLEVGNGGLALPESRSHLTLWAMLAAPLILGNDIRTMSPETRELLTNRLMLSVDQDQLGRAAVPVHMERGWVLLRPLTGNRWAVSLTNVSETPLVLSVTPQELGLAGHWTYQEAWSGHAGTLTGALTRQVNPHDSALFVPTSGTSPRG